MSLKRRIIIVATVALCVLLCVSGMAAGASRDIVAKAAVKSIKLNMTKLSIDPGRTYRLKATVKPASAEQTVRWESSNEAIVKVSDDGTIQPLAYGAARIYAYAANNRRATCVVTVKDIRLKKITLSPTRATVYSGQTRQFTAALAPSLANEYQIVWSSEDESVVTVDQTGLATAVATQDAVAYIRATNPGTGLTSRAKVTVKPVRATSLVLDKETVALDQPGDQASIRDLVTWTVMPANTTNQQAAFQSANPAVATIDEQGVVRAVSPGVTEITVTVDGGRIKASCILRVRGKRTTVLLSAAGDVILGGDVHLKRGYYQYKVLNETSEQTFRRLVEQEGNDPFLNVKSYFQADDFSIVNLENVLTTARSYREKPFNFRGKPEYADYLVSAGIEAATLVNNHAYDFGNKGLVDTCVALKQRGIVYCTDRNSKSERYGSYIVTRNGVEVKIGICGFMERPGTGAIRNAVKYLKETMGCDIAIANFHWTKTKEWKSYITKRDRIAAQAAIDAGADLVLGHHRHTPAGIEMYKDKLIVYDLSNFVVGIKHMTRGSLADGTLQQLNMSYIFQQKFEVDESGFATNAGFRIIPCVTTRQGETEQYPYSSSRYVMTGALINRFQPSVAEGDDIARIVNEIQGMSNVTISTNFVMK